MKIALITSYFPPEFVGGTERVARAQALALRARGHEILVVTGTDRVDAQLGEGRVDGIDVLAIARAREEVYDSVLERPAIRERVLSAVRDCDVVHLHHWWTLSGGIARELLGSTPVVATLHDAFTSCPRFFRLPPEPGIACPQFGDWSPCARCLAPDFGGGEPVALGLLEERGGAWRAEVEALAARIVPSRTHGRALARALALDESHFRVVPHGLCEPAVRRTRELDPYDGSRPLRLLHCGNLGLEKGTLELVHILREMPTGSVHLTLAGAAMGGDFESELQHAARGLPCERTGAYGPEELARQAARADLGVLPSRVAESYGLAVDELLALGLPVWVADHGAPPERVGAGGRALPPGDRRAWVRALAGVLERPQELEQERQAVRAARASGRTVEDAARELELLYTELLARPNEERS